MQKPQSAIANKDIPEFQTSQYYRSAIEQQLQSNEVPYLTQHDVMLAVDAYLNQCIVITTAVLLQGDETSLDWVLHETRRRLAIETYTSREELMDRVCADIATRTGVNERYQQIRTKARTADHPPSSKGKTALVVIIAIVFTALASFLVFRPFSPTAAPTTYSLQSPEPSLPAPTLAKRSHAQP